MKTEVGERIIKILDSFAIYCGLADNHENADIISYICNKKAFIEVPIPPTKLDFWKAEKTCDI